MEPNGRPRYLQVMEAIRASIRSGEFSREDPLPSIQALQARYEVSVTTVRRALGELQREGLLIAQQGSGTYIRGDAGEPQRSIEERLADLERRFEEHEQRHR